MIIPSFLQSGDTVALLAPARKVTLDELQPVLRLLESWGLHVLFPPNLFESCHQFAGTDEQRADDLQWVIRHPSVKAVFCVRGGYGVSRILNLVDFTPLIEKPKWFVGFSDITVLHAKLNQLRVQSIHGPVALLMLQPGGEEALSKLKAILFGTSVNYSSCVHPLQQNGYAKGELIGGNLSLLAHLSGTKINYEFTNKILFIEDLDEYLYHIDRMMVQLENNGVFQKIKGLIVGGLSDMKDNTIPFGSTAEEIVHQHVSDYPIPIIFDFPAGHVANNQPLIFGKTVEMHVYEQEVTLNYVDK